MKRTFYLYVGSWMMRIFIHPSPENLDNRNKSLFPRNLYAGGVSLAPENLDSEAILRLVAVTQSGAYLVYVSICGASQMPKEPVIRIFAN